MNWKEQVEIDWNKLRDKYFKECVETIEYDSFGSLATKKSVNLTPHDLFEWFKREIQAAALPKLEEEKRDVGIHDTLK